MNDIEADSYQWDTPRDSKAPDLKPYAELVKALAEKDREIEQLKAQRLGIDTQRIEARCREFASDPDNYEYRDEKLEMGDYLNVEKLVALYNEAMQKGYRQALTEKERGYQDGQAASTGSHTRT